MKVERSLCLEQGVPVRGSGCSQVEEDRKSQAYGDGLQILLFFSFLSRSLSFFVWTLLLLP